MALSFLFAHEADRDLTEIVDYISVDNPRAAEMIVERLYKSIRLLTERPNMGRSAPATGQEHMRRMSVPPYVVFYRVSDTHIEIARILHSSRYLDDEALFVD